MVGLLPATHTVKYHLFPQEWIVSERAPVPNHVILTIGGNRLQTSKHNFFMLIYRYKRCPWCERWGRNRSISRCGYRQHSWKGVATLGLKAVKEEHLSTSLQPPAYQKLPSFGPSPFAGMLSVEILLWQPTEWLRWRAGRGKKRGGENWEAHGRTPHTKARPVHVLLKKLPRHKVKRGIMMATFSPWIQECERRES